MAAGYTVRKRQTSDAVRKPIRRTIRVFTQYEPGRYYVTDKSSDGEYYYEFDDLQDAFTYMVRKRRKHRQAIRSGRHNHESNDHKIYVVVGIGRDIRPDLRCRICRKTYFSARRRAKGRCMCCCCDNYSIKEIQFNWGRRIKDFRGLKVPHD